MRDGKLVLGSLIYFVGLGVFVPHLLNSDIIAFSSDFDEDARSITKKLWGGQLDITSIPTSSAHS